MRSLAYPAGAPATALDTGAPDIVGKKIVAMDAGISQDAQHNPFDSYDSQKTLKLGSSQTLKYRVEVLPGPSHDCKSPGSLKGKGQGSVRPAAGQAAPASILQKSKEIPPAQATPVEYNSPKPKRKRGLSPAPHLYKCCFHAQVGVCFENKLYVIR